MSDATATIEIAACATTARGFDPHRRSTGFGLLGMRERLALVHGTLEIESAPGAGPPCAPAIPRP